MGRPGPKGMGEHKDLGVRVPREVADRLDEHRGAGTTTAAARVVLSWWAELPKRERNRAFERKEGR